MSKTTAPKAKALAARKAALKGTAATKTRKVRTTSTFRLPKTLKLARNPKYARKSAPSLPRLTALNVLKHPLTTESAMKKIEDENTLVFITDVLANKHQIKQAVKTSFDVKVQKVRTLIRPDGKKKAYVRLTADYDAMEVANKIGFV
ncbi:archaeal ribosomal protein L23 [Allomyces macrogynus ATCC 38327]|uniref:Archaeal ribosomal protein L23 n=1 Tax=Allomyces macrogynus (strain ATCC 38327) TaxID=578462 RepID=A0A0L0T060_ALLM3|nr:60S ribosomal protein L23A [Allomyces javanicus]KAJ3370852.1 60S ribosomal protein L23A [Allomyces arbusculus]KNE68178.1 archaeal ribosomal protein L23 [Allomyces macrogynus ATCC 38327]|eukprot:KNE68178.1 archaeal ribosomal protein L23 [Allomyces macrogynus ATCC 38327]